MKGFLTRNLWEIIVGVGTVVAAAGGFLMHLPLTLVVLGVAIIVFGFWGAKSWAS